jgi:protein-disulfide isomerase
MPQFRGLSLLFALVAGLFFGAVGAWAQQTPQGIRPVAPGPAIGTDMVLGRPDAPVTVIEYASLTCPHCAAFHETIWPQLKTQYIDTGKVRFIYRDFPLDEAALRGAQLARCQGSTDAFFGFVDILFPQQKSWANQQWPANLQSIARIGGISESQFRDCMNNKDLSDAILKMRLDGVEKYKVNGTPTIIVNEQNIGSPNTFEQLRQAIEAALGGSAQARTSGAQGAMSPAGVGPVTVTRDNTMTYVAIGALVVVATGVVGFILFRPRKSRRRTRSSSGSRKG